MSRKEAMAKELERQYAEKSEAFRDIEEMRPATAKNKHGIAERISEITSEDVMLCSLILFLLSDYSDDDITLLFVLFFLLIN